MASGGAWSLLEAAIKFKAFEANLKLASEAILVEWAVMVRDKAKESIGEYHYGWPPLAESTVARKGGRDTPLLDTGALRDSISAQVRMNGPHHGSAVVGTDDEHGVYAELGTAREPPRPFLLPSALAVQGDIEKLAKKYIRSAWTSAGHGNELLSLLHAVRALLNVARAAYRSTK